MTLSRNNYQSPYSQTVLSNNYATMQQRLPPLGGAAESKQGNGGQNSLTLTPQGNNNTIWMEKSPGPQVPSAAGKRSQLPPGLLGTSQTPMKGASGMRSGLNMRDISP